MAERDETGKDPRIAMMKKPFEPAQGDPTARSAHALEYIAYQLGLIRKMMATKEG